MQIRASEGSDGEKSFPDVAIEAGAVPFPSRIDRTGMSQIEAPIRFKSADGKEFFLNARAEAYVSLDDPLKRGVHMSRLFLILQESLEKTPLTFDVLKKIANEFLNSHRGLSESAMVRIRFELPVKRKALLSEHYGWRFYPVSMGVDKNSKGETLEAEVEVMYASTCPCSAALARQLVQEEFQKKFGENSSVKASEVKAWLGREDGISATPHSQRSLGKVKLKIKDSIDLEKFIDRLEMSLQTSVQTAVKREDEQEFTRRNGKNLMFCEDAARRMKSVVENDKSVIDYWLKAEHIESLHPHDAISVLTKGVPGGYTA